jgi:hypothetical protein
MAPDRNPELASSKEVKLAEVIDLDSRRHYRVIPDTDDLATELGLMQPPPMVGEWESDGNLFMHDRMMVGHRSWPSLYDRKQQGTVSRHPAAPEADYRLPSKLFGATSSLGKFITLKAAKRSAAMSDEDITGIPDFDDEGGESPTSVA